MSWSDEQIETLKTMWAAGNTAAEIAKEIGDGKTRNAIIGKAHRLKLSTRESPIKSTKVEVKKKHHMTVKKEERLSTRAKINVTVYGPGKPMEDLGARDCRWPVGEDENVIFCGAPIKNGSYCVKHSSINYSGKVSRYDQVSRVHGKTR